MPRKTKTENNQVQQLVIQFEEIVENLGIPANYDFSKLKKLYLPNNPLTDLPLFLPSKTKAVNASRKRFNEIMNGKPKDKLPKIDVDSLVYYAGNFTIKSDMDYGLPDEFDGQVFDCLMMLISKEYVEKSKVFKGYRIDENIIMNELIRNGLYKRGGKLYNRIKYSLNRMFHTSYIINEKSLGQKGEINYIEILYKLVDGIYRKGKKFVDNNGGLQYLDHTIVMPHSSIISSIEEKKYFIVANEKRYALNRYLSKVIYDKLHVVVYAQIFSNYKEIFIAQKFNSYPYFAVGYEKFCTKTGIPTLTESELRPSKVKTQLESYLAELREQKVIVDMETEKKNNSDDINLVFIFTWEFIDRVFEMANKSMNSQGIDKITNEMIQAYYSKMEKQIQSKEIKDRIRACC
ncbi:MAG: hypothetical protein GXX85_00935 [Ignavibacteria bacterium]|nr:hypothetical protein [Ignavibacteria bacterium]